jgi:hypothetical protein
VLSVKTVLCIFLGSCHMDEIILGHVIHSYQLRQAHVVWSLLYDVSATCSGIFGYGFSGAEGD